MKSQSLDTVSLNTTVRVISLPDGRHAREKLMSLGIVPGETIRVRKNDYGGPLIVDVHGSKTVLGLGLANKVTVSPVEKEE